MRNNVNQDGNFEYKYLKLPISVRNKRRFVKWLERNEYYLYSGYDVIIHLPTRRLFTPKTLMLCFKK